MDQPASEHPLYLDPKQPIAARVADLISRLTLEEKISQMISDAAGIPRLGIPAYNYWSEGLHGVGRNGKATVFPQAIAMAATWDPTLVEQVATAISDEARAKYHETLRRNGSTSIYQGLTFWSPNINIFRDPRWGRGQETWGEDPTLTGLMGSAFVRGLQGNDPRYLKLAACAKHFAVHSGPEALRHEFDAQASAQDLEDTYLPAFRQLVTEARVESVMGAYNRINGDPACASPFLLQQTLRDQWGFQGHVVSDCWALTDIHNGHKVTRDPVESAALALRSGCDLSCMCTYDRLGEAIERGLISEADIDQSLARTLATRFKLGMFDPDEQVPYSSISMDVVASPAHRELAYQTALRSMVLLKNKNGILPADKVESICVVGPNATNIDILLGNYYGVSDHMVTLLEGLVGALPEGVRFDYRAGVQLLSPNLNSKDWSTFEAIRADLTIACMGISPWMEGEEGDAILSNATGDRPDIRLPKVQIDYVRNIATQGGRVVLVLAAGSPIALDGLEELVEAIIYIWYPGQEGGRAVADVIFGKAVPSGKLPLTFPRSVSDLPPFEDYRMDGRTYRYSTAEPLFPFGFGLSYTTFAYSDLRLQAQQIRSDEELRLTCTVTNTGSRAGDEVAQIYLTDREASTRVPLAKLVGFQRLALGPGESRQVEFTITPAMLALVDEQGQRRIEPGEFLVTVGSCAPGSRGQNLGAPVPQTAVFTVS